MALWLAVLGGLAVFNALFLGGVLLWLKPALLKNKLLAFLFFSLALRNGKSLVILIFRNVPDSVPAIGLLGMVVTGPLLLLYIRSNRVARRRLSKKDRLHLLPFLLFLFVLPFSGEVVVRWLYIFASLQLAVYLIASCKILRTVQENRHWLRTLSCCIVIFWAVYTSQIFTETITAYLIETAVAAAALYVLLQQAFSNGALFRKPKPPKRFNSQSEKLLERMERLMKTEEVYKETDLTIAKLAERLGVKPYVVSHVLNAAVQKSFPEFVNGYRIKEAERMLVSAEFRHYSIEAIAFESGFNTPSAFYTTFKKIKKCTPTEYKASHEMGG